MAPGERLQPSAGAVAEALGVREVTGVSAQGGVM